MGVPRGTTPTFLLTFDDDDLDLTMAHNVYVTFKSEVTMPPYRSINKVLTKTGQDIEVGAKTISVYLSQSETLLLQEGDVKIQANWTTVSGCRAASTVCHYRFTEQLLPRVVE